MSVRNTTLQKLDDILASLGGGLSGVSSTGADLVIREDGKTAIAVDTEIVLNADNITIDNLTKLAQVRHYADTNVLSGGTTIALSGTASSVLVTNTSTTVDGQVSFDGGSGWFDIVKNYGGIGVDSNSRNHLAITSIKVRSKTSEATSVQIITVEV